MKIITVVGFGLALLLPTTSAAAQAVPRDALVPAPEVVPPAVRLRDWLATVPLDPGVAREMERFRDGSRGPLSASYRQAAAGALRQEVRRRVIAAAQRIEAEGCSPSSEVDYPGMGTTGASDPDGRTQKKFEDSFVFAEMMDCYTLNDPDLEAILRLYTDPDFRMEAQDRIERIWDQDGLSCVHTGGVPVLLDATKACNRITELLDADLASQHSQVVAGGGEDGFQTVFYKESVKTFIRTPEGVALHYVNITRSVTLSGLMKRMGRGKIEDSQNGQAELLRTKLGELARR